MKRDFYILALAMNLVPVVAPSLANAQDKPKTGVIAHSVRYSVPSGYAQVGTTDLYYRQTSGSIDFIGRFGSGYYSSTYSDGGYTLAIKVGNNSAVSVDCQNGTTVSGVSCNASVTQQGDLGRVIYSVTNTTDSDVVVSLGTHADVMIGNNDSAPIARRIDTAGNTYGLTMKDGNGAQLCVLFGAGLVGVTSVSDFWFGHYSTNRNAYQMVGDYSVGSNYMVENSNYDSGMGWCWKNRNIPANSTVEFSYLIGVGEVNLEPNSSFEVTPDDPDGWNDLSRPHRLTLDGQYESPAGQNGKIQYAVEDSEEWLDLTEEIESGSTFTATLVATFVAGKETHTIRFRTMDAVGNVSTLSPIVYKDVSYHPLTGISNQIYNFGEPVCQSDVSCDLPSDQYVLANYRNNINAGTATFNIEGVFPYTIGRKTYSFDIEPLPLSGEIDLEQDYFVYDGTYHRPIWHFSNQQFGSIEPDRDYTVEWSGNLLPGTAKVCVKGKGNFAGELSADFMIDKAALTNNLYSVVLPDDDVTFDQNRHGAVISTSTGVGQPTFYYSESGQDALTETEPSLPGVYDIYLEIADGELYYGKPAEKIFTFTIYEFDRADWIAISSIVPSLQSRGWSAPWDLSGGIATASRFEGLAIEHGRVVGLDLSYAGLSGTFPVELLALSNLRDLDLSGNDFDGPIEYVALALKQAPSLNRNLMSVNVANNSLSGNIGIFAACFDNLESLDAHGNCLADVYPAISANVMNLDLSDQTIDRTVEYDLSNTSIEELAQQIPTILVYDHNSQSYTKPLILRCNMDDGFAMTLTYVNDRMAIADVSEQNAYHGQNGDVLNVRAIDNETYGINGTLRLKLMFETADANFDGNVSVLDLQTSIKYAFNEYTRYPFNYTAADTYEDGLINVQDVICTANVLLGKAVATDSNKAQQRRIADAATNAVVYIEGNGLYLDSEIPVAAIDIAIDGSADWQIGRYGLTDTSTKSRLIGYSLSGATLPAGKVLLAEVAGGTKIIGCTLADDDAQPISVSASNGVSGLDSIDTDVEHNSVIYNIAGQRLNSLGKGVNIVIDGKGARKILNKKN